VWPFSRSSEGECLRIGRHAVERWKSVDGGLVLQAEHALPRDATPQPQDLGAAIQALYPGASETPITLILESAWLPVMWVDTGATVQRAAQLEALVRHRFGLHYSDSADPVANWELRIEHRAGSGHALAYGLAPQLKQALLEAVRASGLASVALSPALSWGLDRLRPAKTWARATGWWLWPEQDRTLVARLVGDAVMGFNPGAALAIDEAALLRLVEAEGVRLGVTSTAEPIAAATWVAAPRAARIGGRLAWFELQSRSGLPVASGAPTTTRTPA